MISSSTSSSSSSSIFSSSFHLTSHHTPTTVTNHHHHSKMATTTLLNHHDHHHQHHHFKQPLTISIPLSHGQDNHHSDHSLPTCKMNPLDLSRTNKIDLIDRLAETSADIIDSIWQHQRYDQHKIKVVCTKGFIYEILKRSKTTYSNLQVSLFYLFRIKHVVLLHLAKHQPNSTYNHHYHHNNNKKNRIMMNDMICCGRRMFLASLMVASKYLQDKNYRNRAWSRISGLSLNEINAAEFTFLKLINYNLYISKETFDQWYSLLHTYLQKPKLPFFYQLPSSPLSPTFISTSSPSPSMITSSPHYHHHQQSSSTLCYPSPPYDHPSHPLGKKRSLDHDDHSSLQKKRHTSTC